MLCDDVLYLANVGDSSALVFNGDGKLLLRSKQHKPEDPLEIARLRQLQRGVSRYMGERAPAYSAWRVDGQLAMSRAFGDFYLKPGICARPSVATMRLTAPRSADAKAAAVYLLLSSDGVTDCLSDDALVQIAKQHVDAGSCKLQCAQLLHAVETMCAEVDDNKTLLLVRLL